MFSAFSLADLIRSPVVLYLRVSSDRQKEMQTIETQRASLVAFCQREGIEITAIYSDDGVNGDLPFTSRPGASQMLADAKVGKVKTVLVYMYDRLSRDLYEGLTGARLLKEYGASPVSIREMFDINTPFGQYMFAQSLNNAQLMKADFLARADAGRYRVAASRSYIGGNWTYGYSVEGRKPNVQLVPAEDVQASPTMSQADIVRMIFKAVGEEGKSATWCAAHLNALGVPSPDIAKGRRTATKYGWLPQTVADLLHNTTYKGYVTFGKRTVRPAELKQIVTATCPPLVTAELWEQAQAKLGEQKRTSYKNKKNDYLFSGLIKCGECGLAYIGYARDGATGKLLYYRCSDFAMKSVTAHPHCHSRSISGAELLEYIQYDIEGLMQNPDKYRQMIAEEKAKEEAVTVDTGADLKRLQGLLKAKEGERQVILTQLRRGKISESESDQQLDAIGKEAGTIKVQIAEVERVDAIASARQIGLSDAAAYLEHLKERFSGRFPETFPEQRELITRLVKRITIKTEIIGSAKIATAHADYVFSHPPPLSVDTGMERCTLTSWEAKKMSLRATPPFSRCRRLPSAPG